ncbi:MAG: 23S rRNA (adenine(2503)-C(2))-methyltransferase RlmN [Candidatus Hydrogenedens sp.]|jgi:23S rRNA (adenine2503-C2)-methyltransferase|nr:23S rRNA (adenine(2503)-C(2))-methyltransferase RlmN [Candidatus Hydrogenedens sp.]
MNRSETDKPITALLPEEIARQVDMLPREGRQLYRWIHRKRIFDIAAMTDLSKALRNTLQEQDHLFALKLVEKQRSEKEGTSKVLLKCLDGEEIESVLLRHVGRVTFCLSSQAGCALNCSFCATGQSGFRRNLTTAEIVEQALHLAHLENLPENSTPNLVYMGMGEAFQNYEAVMNSIALLTHPEGMGIGARKITLSTAGDVPGIERFSEEPQQLRLSVSLHAADDELRSSLVPLNRRYPLKDLHRALQHYQERRSRQITIEWTLMKDINDSPAQAKQLVRFLEGLDAVVNAIPWNPVSGLPYAPSPGKAQQAFIATLKQAGIKATLRRERGGDIDAACGQLRLRHNS